jgi:hypothetical protein
MKTPEKDGLFLRGEVVARRRKEARTGDKTRYCVTLFVRSEAGTYQADRWSDSPVPEGTPAVGARVELPVTTGAYITHGMAVSRLSWGEQSTGSDF